MLSSIFQQIDFYHSYIQGRLGIEINLDSPELGYLRRIHLLIQSSISLLDYRAYGQSLAQQHSRYC